MALQLRSSLCRAPACAMRGRKSRVVAVAATGQDAPGSRYRNVSPSRARPPQRPVVPPAAASMSVSISSLSDDDFLGLDPASTRPGFASVATAVQEALKEITRRSDGDLTAADAAAGAASSESGGASFNIIHLLLASFLVPVALAFMTGGGGVGLEAAMGPQPQPAALMDMSSQMDASHTFYSSFSVQGF